MSNLTRLTVWDDPAICGALSWYLAVAENRRPAKFRIAATVATKLDPATSGEDALWTELDRLTPIFLARWEAIRAGQRLPPAAEGPSLLELCRELAYRMLGHCNFCPWDCRVDRVAGTRFGACKLAAGSRVSSYFHHTGEELFYRGSEGSGTIFFTSCNMRCAFCQNGDISTDKDNGEETDPRIACGDGLDAAPRGLPQHQLGRRRGRHSPAFYRRRHRVVGPRLHTHAGGAGASPQNEG
jgi:putative pyruvate formate lyase activating enzyme